MCKYDISESVRYIGVDDRDIDLFEGQYVVPEGMSYNSYLILDEKVAVMDTADRRRTDAWLANLEAALDGRKPDYLVSLHVEPDHSGSIRAFADKYPGAEIICSIKAAGMMGQFFDCAGLKITGVKEGDILALGSHALQFIMAPMVHWPEVMVAYEQREKILFSADGFGKFGALDADEDWTCEARRYYFNIVGKYGVQVKNLLKKAAALDIRTICPLHGPILREDLGYYIGKYRTWSSYAPEDTGVFVAYASIHGGTAAAVERFAEILRQKGAPKVVVSDLARSDMAENIEDAFRYDRLVVASPTYDGNLFPVVEDFLYHLKIKTYRSRRVGIIENGSWAPAAAKLTRAYFEEMKDVEIVEPMVSLRSTMKEVDVPALEALADALLK